MSTHNKVLKRMAVLGLSKEDVSKHIRVPVKTFSLWLKGRGNLSYDRIWFLWDFLKLDKEDFVNLMLFKK